MKKIVSAVAAIAFSVVAAPTLAAGTPCPEVVDMIAAKLDAKGVVGYTLTPTAKDQVQPEDKVVGVCEGGTMDIVYVRGGVAPAAQPAASDTPPAPQ